MKFTLLFLVFTLLSFFSSAQVSKDTLLVRYMNEVKSKVQEEDFVNADKALKNVFTLNMVLPDEVAFYYGFIQVKLQNYVKGKQGLQKYIQLTEGAGMHYQETLELLNEANFNICNKCNNTGFAEKTDTCAVCKGVGKLEEPCNKCQDNSREICSSCNGKGVKVFKNSLSTSYVECSKCNGKGMVDCSSCSGTKITRSYCSNCKGIGFFKEKVTCDHPKD